MNYKPNKKKYWIYLYIIGKYKDFKKVIFNIFKPKKQIEYLIAVNATYEVCPKGEFQMDESKYQKGVWKDECSIKHLGNQIYLIGYFDFYKAGGSFGGQNRINKYIIVFPNVIKYVSFK